MLRDFDSAGCLEILHRNNGLGQMNRIKLIAALLLAGLALMLLPSSHGAAQQAKPTVPGPANAAGEIADFFLKVGDQIYEDCIFELSQEQVEVQQALIEAYIKQGASHSLARQLAVKQIQPPKLSAECEQMRGSSKAAAPKTAPPTAPKKAPVVAA